MTMTDPIADMLTRIRNAARNHSKSVDCPSSKVKEAIAAVLREEGFIEDFRLAEAGAHKTLRLYLKYGSDGEKIINEIERVSKPGRRSYVGSDEIPRVLDGLGISILSTPAGVLSDRKCRQLKVGGELLCTVW
jgi:small subunit ribosomal protein S8